MAELLFILGAGLLTGAICVAWEMHGREIRDTVERHWGRARGWEQNLWRPR